MPTFPAPVPFTEEACLDSASTPPLLLHGWYVLHQFFRCEAGSRGTLQERLYPPDGPSPHFSPGGAEGWSGAYRLLSGESDLLLVHFRSSAEALPLVDDATGEWASRRGLIPDGRHLSVVELGLYSATVKAVEAANQRGIEPGSSEWTELVEQILQEERRRRHVPDRLQPAPPSGFPWISVYPMNRRRTGTDNWYLLPLVERATLMAHHGHVGRRYAGRLTQVISGSTGLSDWEWMVTLFAPDPLIFKEVVTEMRYMESTARFGEFGPFHTGVLISSEPP